VEKDRFNYLVRNYNSLTQQETAELRAEQNHFSYSQLLQSLIARGDQDNQTEMKDFSLTMAAVYSTDRAVLKQIMTEPRTLRNESFGHSPTLQEELSITPPPVPVVEVVVEAVQPKIELVIEAIKPVAQPVQTLVTTTAYVDTNADTNFDPEVALSRFIADLGPMREMKLKFERALEEFEKAKTEPIASEISEKTKRKPRTSKNTNEQLLEEIKTTKKKIVPESQKQIDQIEIIDQFIKTKPIIPKAVSAQTELDLSGPDTYNENVVSETLALILIKQGKKDKAIEVLRKLIWKFPQKKAYFAAQIEDLTK
jgi:tetratricopeptide (TPR) repeat protein